MLTMAWTQIHWQSEVLQKQTTMQVLLPARGRPPFAVFYLLHGLSDDSTTWMRHTRLEWYVRDLPLMVVMPDGYRGFYTDNVHGPAYAQHFGREVVDYVDRHFRTKAERCGRAIGGLSMGGYGALRVGLGFADRFCSVNSHSGAVGRGNVDFSAEAEAAGKHDAKSKEFLAELRRIFGENPAGSGHDIVQLAKSAQRANHLPEILMDCGTEDYLLLDNRDCHRALEAAAIPHDYREFSGAHDWDYWDAHIQDALTFHAANLGIKRTR
jgi:putative tributyrin esterase